MESVSLERYLEPPPRLVEAVEALPHLGGLALASPQGALPDEIEAYEVHPLKDAFDNATAQKMLESVLKMPRARERLDRNCVMIGVSRRGETAKGEDHTYLVVAYDYNANMAVEISLDDQGELRGISDESYQPPPVQDEIDRAIALARLDHRLATRIEGLVGMAIPFSGVNNEFANRRVLEVLFGCRTDRLPKYRAWVDLGTENVLYAGETCECCDQHEEVRS